MTPDSSRTRWTWLRGLAAATGLAIAGTTPAAAQQPALAPQPFYEWTAPTAEAQLAADTTTIPPNMGALFVPAMSDGQDEPDAVVFQGGRRVATGPNGRRIVVAPGTYRVLVGSGPEPQMVESMVTVTAGQTAMVPVSWGGLRVDVVDGNNIPHRGSFELIRVSDRQPYTIGFGADTLTGERLRTILMPSGLYRVVRPGADYRARTDFATVLVPERSLVHFKLVLDPDNGRLLGAGVVPPEEMVATSGAVSGSGWSQRFTLGVGVPISSTRNVIGATNQSSIGADVVFDTYLVYNQNKNHFSTLMEVEAGFIRLDPESTDALPVQKTRDRLRVDALYTRFINPRIGPYARLGILTNLFESKVLVTEDTVLTRRFLDGSQTVQSLAANQNFLTGDALAPVFLRQGVGVNVRLLRGRASFLDWRGGVGSRQNLFRNAFVLVDSSTPGALTYAEVDDFNQVGLETTVVGSARLGRMLVNTNVDVFADFDDVGEPTVDWRNTLSWRVTGDLSVDYRLDLLRLPQVTSDSQITQALLLRYSWGS